MTRVQVGILNQIISDEKAAYSQMNDAGVAFTYFHKDVYCNNEREMKI